MRAEPSPVPFLDGEVAPADLWVDEDTASTSAATDLEPDQARGLNVNKN
jgi:hypothetical protein